MAPYAILQKMATAAPHDADATVRIGTGATVWIGTIATVRFGPVTSVRSDVRV